MRVITEIVMFLAVLASASCSGGAAGGSVDTGVQSASTSESDNVVGVFNADSAYSYISKQVGFGPRVPGSEAHRETAAWLESELRRHGAEVTVQRGSAEAFDGTRLGIANIMGSYNADKPDRLLLLAHYDTRPWADQDPDPSNRDKPIDGANDGASGVGVLLETARMLASTGSDKGIDILFVDCEDYGSESVEDSWALGTKYFVDHPIKEGYRPSQAILLDMVGGEGASFPAEYFSRRSAPELDDAVRRAAAKAGHGKLFPAIYGGAVTDDHVQLIDAGIPAIDIIDYRAGGGFCPTWHTMDDNLDHIDRETLRAVGETLFEYIRTR